MSAWLRRSYSRAYISAKRVRLPFRKYTAICWRNWPSSGWQPTWTSFPRRTMAEAWELHLSAPCEKPERHTVKSWRWRQP